MKERLSVLAVLVRPRENRRRRLTGSMRPMQKKTTTIAVKQLEKRREKEKEKETMKTKRMWKDGAEESQKKRLKPTKTQREMLKGARKVKM